MIRPAAERVGRHAIRALRAGRDVHRVLAHEERSRVVLEAGSAWYLRLSDPHSVVNKGASDRVHMVIDAVANDWIRAMLELAARQPA